MAPKKAGTGSKGKGKSKAKAPGVQTTKEFANGATEHVLDFG